MTDTFSSLLAHASVAEWKFQRDSEDGQFYIPSLAYALSQGNNDRHFSCDEAGLNFPDDVLSPTSPTIVLVATGEEYDDSLPLHEALVLAEQSDYNNAHVVWAELSADNSTITLRIFWYE